MIRVLSSQTPSVRAIPFIRSDPDYNPPCVKHLIDIDTWPIFSEIAPKMCKSVGGEMIFEKVRVRESLPGRILIFRSAPLPPRRQKSWITSECRIR